MKTPQFLLPLAGLALTLCCTAAGAASAHQHGVARLDVAVEAKRITLYLDTPLDSLLGFEHAPRTDAERQRADAAVARLKAADTLFRIDGKAGCTLAKVELTSVALGLGAAGAAPEKEGHADLEGQFDFDCTAGASAGFVEVGLFVAFAPLRRVELQLTVPRGQMKATLLRPASRVALVR